MGLCLSYSSCSKDDNDSVKDKLVGVWNTSMRSSNWKCIELKSNGDLSYEVKVDNDGYIQYSDLADEAHWIYDENEKIISMFTPDGYYSFSYTVNMASDGNSWTGIDSSGKTVSFTRVQVKNR